MIKRSDLNFLKNILSLHNTNVNLEYLTNVLTVIEHNEELTDDILDSFSVNQFESKRTLLEIIDSLNILDQNSEITIWGCWYGSILIPELSKKSKMIHAIDLDANTIRLAKNKFFPDYKNVEFIADDIFSSCRQRYHDTNLFINTSCEHMPPMNEWPYWKKLKSSSHFAFQSNNMFNIEGHVNCVNSLEEFKKQLPSHFEVLIQDELKDDRGTRYMLIGKIHGQF
jgi:hypothetical protein